MQIEILEEKKDSNSIKLNWFYCLMVLNRFYCRSENTETPQGSSDLVNLITNFRSQIIKVKVKSQTFFIDILIGSCIKGFFLYIYLSLLALKIINN